jgi:uncharacterized protein (DUF302 family)
MNPFDLASLVRFQPRRRRTIDPVFFGVGSMSEVANAGCGGRRGRTSMKYGRTIEIRMPYAQAVPRVKQAFKDHGFGTLTEIDVKKTLKEKLDVDMEEYVILGVCNPGLAHRALETERDLGLLLPCNVVVRESGGKTLVQALDPDVMVKVPERPELQPIAQQAGKGIDAALQELAALG